VTQPDDRGLLEAAQAGDDAALEALLSRYQPQILRFSLKMCRVREDAEDVLQETLLSVARSLRGFRGASSVTTWLYTIARSFCIKKRRKRKGEPEVELSLEGQAPTVLEVPDHAPGPDTLAERREIGAALEDAIGTLGPGYREVLVLRDVEGLTAPEVAEVTGLTVEAVKSRLHRARAAVRQRLAPLLQPAPPPAGGPACPDIVDLFSRHLEDEISADVCARMEQHLAGCPGCQAACESLKQTLRLCRTAQPPVVPETLQRSIRAGIRSLLAQKG
jgi:RNA polymerase sigma-70 factor (ECF subfamily)